MKIALFTADGNGLPVADKLEIEGHEVYTGVVSHYEKIKVKRDEKPEERQKRMRLFEGILEHKWEADRLLSFLLGQPRHRREEWLVLCDFNHLWPYAERLKSAGFRGLLPTRADFELEHDRHKAKDFIQKHYEHVEVAENEEFKKIEEGKDYLEEHDGQSFVLKGFNDECPTVVPDTKDDEINQEIILDSLERNKKHYEKDGFLLEEKIPDLIEFTPEAVSWDGQVVGVNMNIEHKQLGSRHGFMTGCNHDIVEWLPKDSEVYRRFLKPMEKMMLRKGEITIWDLSVFWSPSRKKFFAGEYCPNRPGFDAWFTEIATHGTVTEWLTRLLEGDLHVDKMGVSLREFNLQEKRKEELLVGDISHPHVWPWDVQLKDDKIYTVGAEIDVLVVTGVGDSVGLAIDNLFKNVEQVHFDSAYHLEKRDFYDTDYPQNVLHRRKILTEIGLLEGGDRHGREKSENTATERGKSNVASYARSGAEA